MIVLPLCVWFTVCTAMHGNLKIHMPAGKCRFLPVSCYLTVVADWCRYDLTHRQYEIRPPGEPFYGNRTMFKSDALRAPCGNCASCSRLLPALLDQRYCKSLLNITPLFIGNDKIPSMAVASNCQELVALLKLYTEYADVIKSGQSGFPKRCLD